MIRVLRTARGIKSCIRVVCHRTPGKLVRNNNQDPTAHSQEWRQDDTQSRAPGNWYGVMKLQVQRAPRNWCEVMTVKSKGEGWNSTMSKHPTIDNLNVFKNLPQKLNLAEEAPVLDWKANVLIWWLFMSTTMTAADLFGLITMKIWKFSGARTSKTQDFF